jgi:hypothetical protein
MSEGNGGTTARLQPVVMQTIKEAGYAPVKCEAPLPCGECDRGRVPTWDGDGNETGDEPCKRCDGTGFV